MTNDRRLSRDPAHQRLEREADPRAGRSLALALLAAGLVVALGLGLTALRVQQVQLAYRLDAQRAERVRMDRLVQELQLEIATLSSPARIESRARKLGLVAPSPEQVHLAREYVATAPGAHVAAAPIAGAHATAPARRADGEALVR